MAKLAYRAITGPNDQDRTASGCTAGGRLSANAVSVEIRPMIGAAAALNRR